MLPYKYILIPLSHHTLIYLDITHMQISAPKLSIQKFTVYSLLCYTIKVLNRILKQFFKLFLNAFYFFFLIPPTIPIQYILGMFARTHLNT